LDPNCSKLCETLSGFLLLMSSQTSRISWLWSKNEKCMGDLLISRFFSEVRSDSLLFSGPRNLNNSILISSNTLRENYSRKTRRMYGNTSMRTPSNSEFLFFIPTNSSRRRDISNELKTFKFPVLLFIGEHAQEYEEMVTTRGYLQGSAHDWISVLLLCSRPC